MRCAPPVWASGGAGACCKRMRKTRPPTSQVRTQYSQLSDGARSNCLPGARSSEVADEVYSGRNSYSDAPLPPPRRRRAGRRLPGASCCPRAPTSAGHGSTAVQGRAAHSSTAPTCGAPAVLADARARGARLAAAPVRDQPVGALAPVVPCALSAAGRRARADERRPWPRRDAVRAADVIRLLSRVRRVLGPRRLGLRSTTTRACRAPLRSRLGGGHGRAGSVADLRAAARRARLPRLLAGLLGACRAHAHIGSVPAGRARDRERDLFVGHLLWRRSRLGLRRPRARHQLARHLSRCERHLARRVHAAGSRLAIAAIARTRKRGGSSRHATQGTGAGGNGSDSRRRGIAVPPRAQRRVGAAAPRGCGSALFRWLRHRCLDASLLPRCLSFAYARVRAVERRHRRWWR